MTNAANHLNNFSYQSTKSGKVLLYWKDKPVKILTGEEAAQFKERIKSANEDEAGLIRARVTGNFKRGNERHSQPESRERK